MSVLARKRQISRHEHTIHFVALYEYTEERLSKMAKRKYRWLGAPIASAMNRMRDEIMQLEDTYYSSKKSTKEQCVHIIRELLELQKPLIALWNVEGYQERRMKKWASLIDREINLLADVAELGKRTRHMMILDHAAINRMDCMKTMSKLHRTIYSKSISLPTYCRETKGSFLMRIADEALYRLFVGNSIIPKTKLQYEVRKKNISRAMNCLKSMEQPIFSIFNILNYSNETMEEIAEMITEEEKLIVGLMKPDEKRISGLK